MQKEMSGNEVVRMGNPQDDPREQMETERRSAADVVHDSCTAGANALILLAIIRYVAVTARRAFLQTGFRRAGLLIRPYSIRLQPRCRDGEPF